MTVRHFRDRASRDWDFVGKIERLSGQDRLDVRALDDSSLAAIPPIALIGSLRN